MPLVRRSWPIFMEGGEDCGYDHSCHGRGRHGRDRAGGPVRLSIPQRYGQDRECAAELCGGHDACRGVRRPADRRHSGGAGAVRASCGVRQRTGGLRGDLAPGRAGERAAGRCEAGRALSGRCGDGGRHCPAQPAGGYGDRGLLRCGSGRSGAGRANDGAGDRTPQHSGGHGHCSSPGGGRRRQRAGGPDHGGGRRAHGAGGGFGLLPGNNGAGPADAHTGRGLRSNAVRGVWRAAAGVVPPVPLFSARDGGCPGRADGHELTASGAGQHACCRTRQR